MSGAGASRNQIVRALNAAYATGLLSTDTFVQRTDQVLGGGLIDPSGLVGDLSVRAKRTWCSDAAVLAARLVARVTRAPEPVSGPALALLALDWTGAQTELLVGRHPACDVVLRHPSVSRRHARVFFRDGRWIVQDLDSTNGTEVNGCRVGRCELRPGDHLALGGEGLTID